MIKNNKLLISNTLAKKKRLPKAAAFIKLNTMLELRQRNFIIKVNVLNSVQ